MTLILDKIVAAKKRELAEQAKKAIAQLEAEISLLSPPLDFKDAITKTGRKPKVIAEVKKASPSKGLLVADFQPKAIAKGYVAGGAAAISVLTESNFFLGSGADLNTVKQNTDIPVLRKDFIIEPYQIYETRAIGADAILLIAAILSQSQLKSYLKLSLELGLSPLVEVHDHKELMAALEADAPIIGINNRNLQTFKVDIATTFTLLPFIPSDKIVVSESGISKDNIKLVEASNIDAVLVGESLVTKDNRQMAMEELLA
ncbi:MAG: indole-3-glycerol phosphate synthase TrpC [Bacillota bacterium]|nr:indole-3-glycerol phosphate synthase TrpC [Bacillota bacterium]